MGFLKTTEGSVIRISTVYKYYIEMTEHNKIRKNHFVLKVRNGWSRVVEEHWSVT